MSDFPDDFFRQENPDATPDSGTGGALGGLIWGSWGPGGMGGGGGGTPPPPGAEIDGSWSKEDDEKEDEKEEISGEWQSVKVNFPFLKRAESGFLLLQNGALLLGQLLCSNDPKITVSIQTGIETKHLDCVLVRFSDNRQFSRSKIESNYQVEYRVDWGLPGKFDVSLRWQSGHYKYSEISQMGVNAFGIDLGFFKVPMSHYLTIARIEIKEDYTVYVNYQRGTLRT